MRLIFNGSICPITSYTDIYRKQIGHNNGNYWRLAIFAYVFLDSFWKRKGTVLLKNNWFYSTTKKFLYGIESSICGTHYFLISGPH